MSQLRNDYSYEELLRRALHSAADSVEPAGDGLERIRAGLTTPHSLPVAWVMAGYSEVARRAQGLLSAMTWRRLAEPSGTPQQRRLARLRLVAGVAAVTIVMAMGVSTLTPFGQQVLSQAGALLHSIGVGGPVGPGGTAGPGAAGQGTGAAGGAGAGNGPQGQGQVAANCVSQTPVQASQPASPSARPGPVNGPSSDSPSPTSPSPSDSPSSASPAPTGGAGPAGAGPASTTP